MKRVLKKLEKFKKPKKSSLAVVDALGSSSEPATSTSMIIASAADPILSVPNSPTIASDQVIQATSVIVSVQLGPSLA